jgi:haloalkane dehalogenase
MKPPSNSVLLSSVSQPFGQRYGDAFAVSHEASLQLLWAQGIFRTRGTTTQWSLDLIAKNIARPATTLHYPTMRRFVHELRKGYEWLGIAFNATTHHKMLVMVKAARREAPETKIMLGGYGTILPNEWLPKVDAICRGEGVGFVRRLLGEDDKAPVRQPDIIQKSERLFGLPLPPQGYLFAGLGCPNGCDFCVTSHYFRNRHIPLLKSGEEILSAIKQIRRLHPGTDHFYIIDEDFLLDEKRARAFLNGIRRSNLPPLSISIFASMKALSRYEPTELVEMGIDLVWIGFEGLRAGYEKLKGRSYEETFGSLRRHGISIITSMIIGFDYQTEDIIREEFDYLMCLRPTIAQYLIYGPAYGTPLYQRLINEGRIDEEIIKGLTHYDGFTLAFRHPHLERVQAQRIQRSLYEEEFVRLGPSVFRMAEDWVCGYENLRTSSASRAREKAFFLRNATRRILPLLSACKRYLNQAGCVQADRLAKKIIENFGKMSLTEKILSIGGPALLKTTDLAFRFGLWDQPKFSKRSYRW